MTLTLGDPGLLNAGSHAGARRTAGEGRFAGTDPASAETVPLWLVRPDRPAPRGCGADRGRGTAQALSEVHSEIDHAASLVEFCAGKAKRPTIESVTLHLGAADGKRGVKPWSWRRRRCRGTFLPPCGPGRPRAVAAGCTVCRDWFE